ncbi:hypothetical protein AWC05_00815 [Mycobacterium florentinum]|uniref:Uncharacterized protein n=1 Tax=Mycobacterium florentinum TaxID=292462 RepID=A0A1X1TYP1_MYCFL|nr:hypothetical protein [Mycobacterium florentinum]MCV7409220.1 hypothetical protein [Mycobacterium florentinum]ORV49696.1 hypothetical protein AWC05_00815 [Mycobacterium florentinum]BBX78655.1 hypothetical protein MFLOJ_24420 [Mycobacterium florentinum]
MHGYQELTEEAAFEGLLGRTYPWLPRMELRRASEFLVTHMDKLCLDDSPEFTPELMAQAEEMGLAFAAEFNLSAPNLGTSPSARGLLQRLAVDALHKVGIGR